MIAKTSLVAALATLLGCSGPSPNSQQTVPGGPDHTEPTSDKDSAKPMTPRQKFARACRDGLEKGKALLPTIVGVSGARTLDNTVEPYDEMNRWLDRSAAMASVTAAVHPDEGVRDEARACEREVTEFITSLGLNKDLYAAFAGLDVAGADAVTKRLVEHTLRDFRRSGVDRDEATRERLTAIDKELTDLGQTFRKNITEDVRHIELTDADQMKGLPADYIKSHAPGDDGKIRITTDYPDYIPFISYADDNDLRRQLYLVYKARGDKNNPPVLKKILTLRDEKAKLLGYANWADYETEDKMMKSAKNAAEFIDRVSRIAAKRAQRDYQELLARKRKDVRGAKRVEDYEKSYYENKVKQESYQFDPQSVRPYFEYNRVEAGLLDITSRIYDIQYVKVTDAEVWHPSVKVFDVVRGDDKLGRIYLDMHPREGKYKHAAQFTVQSGVRGKQLPEGALVCNLPDPSKSEGPALMEHGDVVTMFHEFGHLMHHVLGGDQRYIEQSGVATEWDFVEAPSQMFEEWAWSHETLSRFAKHYETGAPIPAELVERMRRADKFGLGVQTVQQMFYASISLSFHTADPASLDMQAKVKELQAKYTPFRFVEGTSMHTNFGHLYGYSALYYTYMWSLVIAKDLLTPFHEHGLMNTEWTHRYRDKILVPGGTQDAAELVKDFLGRPYSFQAFEDYLSR